MIKVAYADQMRRIDKTASELCKIPSIVLMENAAIECVKVIESDFTVNNLRTVICCGIGNNGGDGLAIARHLFNKGSNVTVIIPTQNPEFSTDAKINYDIVTNLNIKILYLSDPAQLQLAKHHIAMSDIVIDALCGTGINRDITDTAKEIINHINTSAKYVLSVDIPSGVNADTGSIHGCAVRADKTVTFAAYKHGLLSFPGADYTGIITVADISIPKYIIDKENIKTAIISLSDISIEQRPQNSHKSTYGNILIVAGSKGMTGAAAMASQACLKSGAGLITLATPESLNPVLEEKLTEVMTCPLPDNNGILTFKAKDKLISMLPKYDCLLFGPGLSCNDDIKALLESVITASNIPIIIDADGLNALNKDLSVLKNKKCDIIITPHPMEMSRLCNLPVKTIEADRVNTAKNFAQQHGVYVILKGRFTVTATPSGNCYINTTGNPGMATGGSGDVLAGMLAAFLHQFNDYEKACTHAVYLHGLAGDIAKETFDELSMTPSDIIENIYQALKLCRKDDKRLL